MCIPSEINQSSKVVVETTAVETRIVSKPSRIKNVPHAEDDYVKEMVNNDALGYSTMVTKKACSKIEHIVTNMQSSTTYKVLTKTTQPAHVVTLVVMSAVAMLIFMPTDSNSPGRSSSVSRKPFVMVIYLSAFATHFGSQIWMTFVSGLALYFSLPRHIFGLCQEVLFPKYFAMNSALSLITLILFSRSRNGSWDNETVLQASALGLCAFIEMIVRLYIAPPMLKLMRAKNRIEAAVGKGKEVGHVDAGALSQCPHYMAIQKTFRKVHMAAAIGNLITMACTFMHLLYLANKICIL